MPLTLVTFISSLFPSNSRPAFPNLAFDMLNTLKSLGVTSLIISEVPRSGKDEISKFGFEEFVVDSVVLLNYMTVGGASRNLQILKMRRTDHGKKIYPFEITERGVMVRSLTV